MSGPGPHIGLLPQDQTGQDDHQQRLDPADQDVLTAELGISVRNAGFANFLDTQIELSDEMERQFLPAVGAALRKDQVTL